MARSKTAYKKFFYLPPLSFDQVPEEWQQTFYSLDQPLPIFPFIDDSMKELLLLDEKEWKIALHRVVFKKWNIDVLPHQKRFRKYINAFDPWAQVIYAILELTHECFTQLSVEQRNNLDLKYQNSASWFGDIVEESRQHDMNLTLKNEPIGKGIVISEQRQIIKKMKLGDNPVNPKLFPAFHCLVDAANWLFEHEQYNDQYWTKLIKASSKWAQAREKSTLQETFIKNSHIVMRRGPGRAALTCMK